jgi:hypothetical protein
MILTLSPFFRLDRFTRDAQQLGELAQVLLGDPAVPVHPSRHDARVDAQLLGDPLLLMPFLVEKPGKRGVQSHGCLWNDRIATRLSTQEIGTLSCQIATLVMRS